MVPRPARPLGPSRPFLPGVEVARGAGILGVVLIHATSRPVTVLPVGSIARGVYAVLNNGGHLGLVLFFLLSALVLTYSTSGRGKVGWGAFFARRASQVLLPYVLWSALYVGLRWLVLARFGEGTPLAASRLAFYLYSGRAWYHLYFLAILLQFYLLYPLLRRPFARGRLGFWATAALFGGAQVAYYYLVEPRLAAVYPYPTVFSFLLPLGLGMWLGTDPGRWASWWKRNRLWAVPLLAAAAANYLSWSFASGGAGVETVPVRLASYAYVALGSVAVVLAVSPPPGGDGASAPAPRQTPSLIWAALGLLGRDSFGIYLTHPAFLLVWERLSSPGAPRPFHLSVAGGYAFALVGSWALTRLIRWSPLGKWLLGAR